jgi:hypothetical protein
LRISLVNTAADSRACVLGVASAGPELRAVYDVPVQVRDRTFDTDRHWRIERQPSCKTLGIGRATPYEKRKKHGL